MGQRLVRPIASATHKKVVTLRRPHSVSASGSLNLSRRSEPLQSLTRVVLSRYYPLVMASALSLVGSLKHEK